LLRALNNGIPRWHVSSSKKVALVFVTTKVTETVARNPILGFKYDESVSKIHHSGFGLQEEFIGRQHEEHHTWCQNRRVSLEEI